MASTATGSDGRSRQRPAPSGQESSDGRGGEPTGTPDRSLPRYIYYRLYTKNGPITSYNPIYANDSFISRTLPKLITPPRTALSLKKHLCKIEGLSGPTSSAVFESLSSQTAVVDSFRLSFKEHSGPGLSEDDPIVLVVGVEDAEKRSASTVRSEGLPEAVPPEPRYVYYRLYDDDGAVASKTSFDSDDSSLGRIDTVSIPPPQIVSSFRSQVMRTEGFFNRKVQLFEDTDGDVPMNDNDHLSFQAQAYPGYDEEEPITAVCSKESQGKVEGNQKKAQVNRVESSFSKQIKGGATWNPDKDVQSDWLPFQHNEIMYTDGIKTTGFIKGSSHPYSGYIAMNSAGRKGFVYDAHTHLC